MRNKLGNWILDVAKYICVAGFGRDTDGVCRSLYDKGFYK